MPASNGGEALVNPRMVPSVWGRNNYSEHRDSNTGVTEGILDDCWGGDQCISVKDRQMGTRRGYRGGGGNSRSSGPSGTLPPAP